MGSAGNFERDEKKERKVLLSWGGITHIEAQREEKLDTIAEHSQGSEVQEWGERNRLGCEGGRVEGGLGWPQEMGARPTERGR